MTPKRAPQPDPWPPPWARSVGFLLGIGLIVWETVVDQASHLVVYAVAYILTGLPLARGLDKIADLIGLLTSRNGKSG